MRMGGWWRWRRNSWIRRRRLTVGDDFESPPDPVEPEAECARLARIGHRSAAELLKIQSKNRLVEQTGLGEKEKIEPSWKLYGKERDAHGLPRRRCGPRTKKEKERDAENQKNSEKGIGTAAVSGRVSAVENAGRGGIAAGSDKSHTDINSGEIDAKNRAKSAECMAAALPGKQYGESRLLGTGNTRVEYPVSPEKKTQDGVSPDTVFKKLSTGRSDTFGMEIPDVEGVGRRAAEYDVGKKEIVRVVGPELLGHIDILAWVEWVAANMDAEVPQNPPACGAVAFLNWAKSNREEFFKSFFTRLMPNKTQLEEKARFSDDGKTAIGLIDRVLAAAPAEVVGKLDEARVVPLAKDRW